jgi:hypothetical protein
LATSSYNLFLFANSLFLWSVIIFDFSLSKIILHPNSSSLVEITNNFSLSESRSSSSETTSESILVDIDEQPQDTTEEAPVRIPPQLFETDKRGMKVAELRKEFKIMYILAVISCMLTLTSVK